MSEGPAEKHETVRLHGLSWDGPTPRFLDGALLGNGGLGVVVTTRPDAVVLTLGHNDIWDRRIDESHKDEVLTFDEVLARVEALSDDISAVEADPWFAEYRARMVAAYARPYPRPLPCGSLVLGFDRRSTELLGHDLDIATGVCTVRLRHDSRNVRLEIFVDQYADDVHLRTMADDGRAASPFDRIRLLPDPDGPTIEEGTKGGASTFILPKPGETPMRPGISEKSEREGLTFRELMPSLESGFDAPLGAFEVSVMTDAAFVDRQRPDWYGGYRGNGFLEQGLTPGSAFSATMQLRYAYGADPIDVSAEPRQSWEAAEARSLENWAKYWAASSITLSDGYLERVWYRNTYFAHCVLRAGSTAPGLFGNWMHRSYGAAWHGDYHMNYNAQQAYWGTFSSNRLEQHLPYVDLIERMSSVSKAWAHDYYKMRGAAYPHSAYNTEMTVNPYPNPVWAWEVSESPWAVQSLWWHYLYSQDLSFLRDRAMPLITDVVAFLVDYLLRPDNGPERWNDELVHVYPTVPPELYGLTPGLRLNRDCLLDIALIRFTFGAWMTAREHLGIEDHRLLGDVEDILRRLPDYPTADTSAGPVLVSVPGEDPDVVYNVPIPGMTVFPGEQHSWESDEATLKMLQRSIRRQLVEGGNDLVFANLQEVRLGLLDLDRFRRQLQYCEMGNGTFTDMVLQVHGRYNDLTQFEFMENKGVWVENFALPVVINEMLMQGYSGTIRLFPNCNGLTEASFRDLRAPGAFLVSAEMANGEVLSVHVRSEAGQTLRLLLPWPQGAIVLDADGERDVPPGVLELPMQRGAVVQLRPGRVEKI